MVLRIFTNNYCIMQPAITKTKKSKNDHIRSAIGIYLKQKNYTAIEKFRKSEYVLSHSPKQFVFNKMIEEDISKSNSFLYSNVLCLTSNPSTMDQQFSVFVKFVQNQTESIKSELSTLFGPLLCHLYIDLLQGQEYKPAIDFIRKNAHLVGIVDNYDAPLPIEVNGCSLSGNLHEDSSTAVVTTQILYNSESSGNTDRDYFKKLIEILSTCPKIDAIETSEALVLLRSSRYEINLSLSALNVLKQYLSQKGHVLILNILHTWIHINVTDLRGESENPNVSILRDDAEIDETHKRVMENGIDSNKVSSKKDKDPDHPDRVLKSTPEKVKKSTNIYLRKLKHSNAKLQKFETPTRCIKLSDPDNGLTTANLDSNECHLVGGFDNSLVKLWQLDKNSNKGRNLYRRIQIHCCPWELNNVEYDTNDEDSSDEELQSKIKPYTFAKDVSRREREENFMEVKCRENSFDDNGGICLRGHGQGVTDVKFSAHYPLLYSVSKDKTMRAWKSSTFNCVSVYKGHKNPIWCVSESPINTYVATGSRDLTARLWTLENQSPLVTFIGHTQDVDCISFHPNGNYLATGSPDLSVRLWSTTSGKLLRVFSDCKFPVNSIAFSPNGKFLAVAGEETKIRIFDLAAGSQLAELKDHTSIVTSIAWNSNGSKFASLCFDGSIRVWDVSKIGANDHQNQSTSTSNNKILWHNSGCSKAVKIYFNSNDTISCIGSR